MVSIWFFIGMSLLVNGVLIFGAGLYEFGIHQRAGADVQLLRVCTRACGGER